MNLTDIEWAQHSQNGEDGISFYLLRGLSNPNKTLVEIGCGRGRENCSTALLRRGYRGTVFDAKPSKISDYHAYAEKMGFAENVRAVAMWLTPTIVSEAMKFFPGETPDFFSLDIDGVDLWVFKALIAKGFRPKVCCLEYNAAIGDRPLTIPIIKRNTLAKNHYYGCSVRAWRNLLEPLGYRFVTVCSAGVNCFFVLGGSQVTDDFIDGVDWLEWSDCASFTELYGPAGERFGKVKNEEWVEVP